MKNYVAAKAHGVGFSPGRSQNVPDKYCPICATVFGLAPVEVPLTPKLCGICVDKLKAGQTAFVCGNRYVFTEIATDSVQAFARGRIVQLTPNDMDALEREYQGSVKTKNEQQNPPSNA